VFVFRCARHLYQRIEPWAAPEREPPTASTTKLGDWAANVVIVHRERRHTVATEVAAMAEWTVTGPGDGRILGSVADFTRLLNTHLDGRPLLDVVLRMAEVPCDRLGMARPRDETLRVFSAPHLRLVSR
jgi:hypothetical protein